MGGEIGLARVKVLWQSTFGSLIFEVAPVKFSERKFFSPLSSRNAEEFENSGGIMRNTCNTMGIMPVFGPNE